MVTDIRKISVGKEYPDGAIHYQVGKVIKLQSTPYNINSIRLNNRLQSIGIEAYDIYISNEYGTVLWKTIQNMPIIVENNVDFE